MSSRAMSRFPLGFHWRDAGWMQRRQSHTAPVRSQQELEEMEEEKRLAEEERRFKENLRQKVTNLREAPQFSKVGHTC